MEVITLDRESVYRHITEAEKHPTVEGRTLEVDSDYPQEVDMVTLYRGHIIKTATIGYN